MDRYTESQFYTEDERLRRGIRQLFIVDFGIIREISTDKTRVTVRHCAIQSMGLAEGLSQPLHGSGLVDSETVTADVELLYLGSSAFGLTYDVSVGDIVLLLGSKDFIQTVANTTIPQIPEIFPHYRQENLKAIPLKTTINVSVNITVDTTGYHLDAGTRNVDIYGTNIKLGSVSATEPFVKGSVLTTQLTTILTALQSFSTGLTTANLAANAGTLATAMGVALGIVEQIKSVKIKGE
jgi:hypothetical protein